MSGSSYVSARVVYHTLKKCSSICHYAVFFIVLFCVLRRLIMPGGVIISLSLDGFFYGYAVLWGKIVIHRWSPWQVSWCLIRC